MPARAIAGYFIRKAGLPDLDAAFRIVEEYYAAARVVARDTKAEFQQYYFAERAGIWIASIKQNVVGCIALRELPEIPRSGEIKRMYVRPAHRGQGIAQSLLAALEQFASNAGYDSLYLDSATGMDVAIRFYRRHGYEPCERYNHNPQAAVFLMKRINRGPQRLLLTRTS
ncbi:MAG TPA: GNAT family N-acetyltransferase [Candidatus Acidoferrum sp.]|nr:GNAT family N-acetyltransferase [Candidatus Acidoferrum sp.]